MCSNVWYAALDNWSNWGFCVSQKMDRRSIVCELSLSMSISLSLSIFLSLGEGTHYKNDKLIFIMAVMACLWSSSAPPPIEDVSLMAHHRFLSSERISSIYLYMSSLYLISLMTELHYNGTLQYLSLDLNLHATEHFECIALYGKDCKLVNSIEEGTWYNVLNGNCIGLFLYLIHFIEHSVT